MSWQLHPVSEWGRFSASWTDLLAKAQGPAFLDADHMLHVLARCEGNKELLAVYKSGPRASAITVITPLGAGLWGNLQSPLLPVAPWLAPNADVAELGHALLTSLPGMALGLRLGPLSGRMHPRRPEQPYERIERLPGYGVIHLNGEQAGPIGGDKAESRMLRKQDRLGREGIQSRLVCDQEIEALNRAMTDFAALSANGRSAAASVAKPKDPTGDWEVLLRACAARGQARAYRLYFGDRLVAMDLCLDNGDTLVLLATAYDEAFRSASPLTLLRQAQLQALLREGRFQ